MQKKDISKDDCREGLKKSESKKSASVEFGKEICPDSKKEEKRDRK